MSMLTKLHVNEAVLTVLKYKLSVTQNADYTGRPSSKSVVQPIEFTYESIKNDPFCEKMVSGKMTDSLALVLAPVRMGSESTTIELLDFYVLEQHDFFDGVDSKPMTTFVKISFASLVVNGVVMDVKYWREHDPRVKTAAPTVIKNDEPVISEIYFEDLQSKRITIPKIGTDIYLVLKTVDAIGKTINIDLSDKKKDFMYKGTMLENDELNDIIIKSNTQKEKLTIIEQKN